MSRSHETASVHAIAPQADGNPTGPPPEVSRILGMLAHEFRNPLASLQGCAQTLVDRGEELSTEVRRDLAEVIAKQSIRMDWLIRAAALYGTRGERHEEKVDLGPLLAEAAAFAGVGLDTRGAGVVHGDPGRIRMAVEAVIFVLGPGSRGRVSDPGNVVEIEAFGEDLEQGSRRWKLELAERLIAEEGGRLHIVRDSAHIRAELHFGSSDESRGDR